MMTKSRSEKHERRRGGRELSLRVFIFSLFLLVFGLAGPSLAGATEVEERAEAATEYLDERVTETRGVIRENRPRVRRDSCHIRMVRVATKCVPNHGRGRIRICETAPLPLRC